MNETRGRWGIVAGIALLASVKLLSAQGLDDAVRVATPIRAGEATATLVASAATAVGIDGLPTVATGTVAVHTWLNVRAGPWGRILARLHNGDRVNIVGRVGDWLRISFAGREAFVHGSYVRGSGNAPDKARSQPDPGTGKQPHVVPPEAPNTGVASRGSPMPAAASDTPPPAPAHRPIAASRESWFVAPLSSPPAAGEGRFGAAPAEPMPNRVGWEFGPRDLNHDGVFTQHNGVDLTMPSGTRLNALGDGRVVRVNYDPGGGLAVRIRYDNGYESWYCHLQSVAVHVGDRVAIGQEVARSDSTGQHCMGPHLHMGMRQGGRWIDPRRVPGINLPSRR